MLRLLLIGKLQILLVHGITQVALFRGRDEMSKRRVTFWLAQELEEVFILFLFLTQKNLVCVQIAERRTNWTSMAMYVVTCELEAHHC